MSVWNMNRKLRMVTLKYLIVFINYAFNTFINIENT